LADPYLNVQLSNMQKLFCQIN